jgi:toxin CptA
MLLWPLLAAALLVLLLYLSVVLLPMFAEAGSIAGRRQAADAERLAADRAYIVAVMPRAITRGLTALPALLAPLGLALLWARARSSLARVLLLCWALTPLLFFAVDVAFILQVRYIYFAAPLCCLAFAALLARLWPSRAGRVVVCAAVALVFAAGTLLWLNGALLGVKMSLLPLTH